MRAALIADFWFCGTRVAERGDPAEVARAFQVAFAVKPRISQITARWSELLVPIFQPQQRDQHSRKDKSGISWKGGVAGYLYNFGLVLGLPILPDPGVAKSDKFLSCLGTGTLQPGSTSHSHKKSRCVSRKGARSCSSVSAVLHHETTNEIWT